MTLRGPFWTQWPDQNLNFLKYKVANGRCLEIFKELLKRHFCTAIQAIATNFRTMMRRPTLNQSTLENFDFLKSKIADGGSFKRL